MKHRLYLKYLDATSISTIRLALFQLLAVHVIIRAESSE
jgi:hypothetical protein